MKFGLVAQQLHLENFITKSKALTEIKWPTIHKKPKSNLIGKNPPQWI